MDMFSDTRFRAVLALIVTVLFAVVQIASSFTAYHPDAGLNQTLVALVTLTWGFYFGSATGSKSKEDKIVTTPTPGA